jgi:hypothetical protein
MNDFEKLVLEMRTAQKNYFKAERGTELKASYLRKSKLLESMVDNHLKEKQNPELEL